ncbi:Rv3654c family TadE-like protein [Nocardia sp. NPDC049220]|uniref:Rv3654c family TadE-like protein n=1 Tax=Nocardia sp. NPDC049220 TaxID=3155273 RepID=UPI0033F6C4F6
MNDITSIVGGVVGDSVDRSGVAAADAEVDAEAEVEAEVDADADAVAAAAGVAGVAVAVAVAGVDAAADAAQHARRRFTARAWAVSGEDGVATVFVCLGLVALIAATLTIGNVGTVVVARHRSQAAADLAALTAAGALVDGVEIACAEAEQVALRMQTRIKVCEATEWDVTVTVERNIPIGLYSDRVVRAVARAGPAEE